MKAAISLFVTVIRISFGIILLVAGCYLAVSSNILQKDMFDQISEVKKKTQTAGPGEDYKVSKQPKGNKTSEKPMHLGPLVGEDGKTHKEPEYLGPLDEESKAESQAKVPTSRGHYFDLGTVKFDDEKPTSIQDGHIPEKERRFDTLAIAIFFLVAGVLLLPFSVTNRIRKWAWIKLKTFDSHLFRLCPYLVLLSGSIWIAWILLNPPLYVMREGEKIRYDSTHTMYNLDYTAPLYPTPDYITAIMHSMGIAIITCMIYYLLRKLVSVKTIKISGCLRHDS
jgi:hypothetical protein